MVQKNNVAVSNVNDVVYKNYMPYAAKVLLDRAIPDLQDGLKPSQRRIVYTMYKEKLENKKTKCANIVGATMKLHPHGDQAIYGTMVRMTDRHGGWNLPLIEGKGNFGFINSDIDFAASRYTEATMTKYVKEYFGFMDAVDMLPSYDNRNSEPKALPVSFPAVLANASSGIAVGYSTSIPSFNINDLLEATKAILTNEEFDYMELKPNFSTGGQVVATREELKKIWSTGIGKLYLFAKYNIIKYNNSFTVEVTELPYNSVSRTVIDELYALAKRDSLFGSRFISALDETGIKGFKLCINLRGEPDNIINYMLHKTSMSSTYPVSINVIDNRDLRSLGVKHLLSDWCKWRKSVVTLHFNNEVKALESRIMMLRAYMSFMKNVDIEEWVKMIKDGASDTELYDYLSKRVSPFNQEIFDFLLDLKLKEIKKFSLEQRQLQLDKLTAESAHFKSIADDPTDFIVDQLSELQKKFGTSEELQKSVVYYNFPAHLKPIRVERKKVVDTSTVQVGITSDLFLYKNTPRSKMPECHFTFSCRASDVVILFTEQGGVYKIYLEDIDYTTGKKVGEFIPSLFGVDDIDVVACYILDKGIKYIFGDDEGRICIVESDEFITEKRKQKFVQNGFAGGDIVDSFELTDEEFNSLYLKATSLLGWKATVKISDILKKSKTARTSVFAGNIDNIVGYDVVPLDEVENYEQGKASGVKLEAI